jgi:hypothetical protein
MAIDDVMSYWKNKIRTNILHKIMENKTSRKL